MLSAVYFSWSTGVYGFVLWLPTIIRKGTSIGIEKTGFLAAVPYLLASILMFLVSYVSDRMMLRRALVWPCLALTGAALFTSFLAEGRSFWLAYSALILAGGAMYAPYGSFFAFISDIIPKTVLDEVLALVNSSGALGGFVGTWLVGVLPIAYWSLSGRISPYVGIIPSRCSVDAFHARCQSDDQEHLVCALTVRPTMLSMIKREAGDTALINLCASESRRGCRLVSDMDRGEKDLNNF